MSLSRAAGWTIWVIASVFYAYQYILRVMPNIMLDDIMQQFGVGAAAFGQFSGVYYIGYSLLHLPIGIALDRFGPKKVMTLSILCTVAGLMPLLFADQWMYPVAGRLLIGIGSSAAILGVFKIVRIAFTEAQFPRMLSFSVMIGVLGAIYGGGPISYMRDQLGYQAVVQGIALLGVILAGFTYFLMPDMKSKEESTVLSDLKEVLYNGRVIWTCIFAGLMVGPLEGFADVWGSAFLKNVYGIDSTIAASLPSMIFIGMCFGSPVLSFIADRAGSYLGTIIGAGIGMAAIFFLMLISTLNPGMLTVSFVVLGIACAYQILAIYQATTYVREQVAGLTTALANMIIMIFGYAFHTVISAIISQMGGSTNPEALLYGISIIPAAVTIGTVGYMILWVKDKRPKAIAELSS